MHEGLSLVLAEICVSAPAQLSLEERVGDTCQIRQQVLVATQGVYPGDYTPIAGINNAGNGQLPGGYSYNQPKMSASQLAAAQAAAATNAKADHSLANDVTQVVGSKVTQADAAAVQSALGEQVWPNKIPFRPSHAPLLGAHASHAQQTRAS